VDRVVGISTDKATTPENVYGKTKALMESLFQEADGMSDTRFTLVRYGNVIGSTGSVVPKFRESLAKGEPVHLTDPDMTRFWMGHDEAVDTIQYGAMVAPRGAIAVPMPRAMKLHDLALVALGIEEHRALPPDRFIIDGIRPGEKKHESLISRSESFRTRTGDRTGWGRFYTIMPPGQVVNDKPFSVDSNDPPAGWLGPAEMARLMEAAESV
jgi:UDP-N-acetylglucosamine 4,6-dehydratase